MSRTPNRPRNRSVKNACNYSFVDLFHAASGRDMTPDEIDSLRRLPQALINAWVRDQCARTNGLFTYREGLATTAPDGVLYTQFGRSDPTDGRKLTIERRIAPPLAPPDIDSLLMAAARAVIQEFDRAPASGLECPWGILNVPQYVNRVLQSQGVPSLLGKLLNQRAPDVDLYLITAAETLPQSRRLKQIEYRVDADRNSSRYPLIEFGVELGDNPDGPPINAWTRQRPGFDTFLRPLSPTLSCPPPPTTL